MNVLAAVHGTPAMNAAAQTRGFQRSAMQVAGTEGETKETATETEPAAVPQEGLEAPGVGTKEAPEAGQSGGGVEGGAANAIIYAEPALAVGPVGGGAKRHR